MPRSTALVCLISLFATSLPAAPPPVPIYRRALVARHDPVVRGFDAQGPLSVGNGELAFTVDATGLQTFADAYQAIPLGTMAQWAWHSSPNPERFSIERFRLTPFDAGGRPVPYADIPGDRRTPEIEWLRRNPHRLHLGRIGLELRLRDGREAALSDVARVEQVLHLWQGLIRSRFELEGVPVAVETLVHPRLDAVAARVRSPLVEAGRLAIRLDFPYGSSEKSGADWTRPKAHTTVLRGRDASGAALERRLDGDRYHVRLAWSPGSRLSEVEPHRFRVEASGTASELALVAAFSPDPAPEPPAYETARRDASEHWARFWSEGGAVDLSGSRDRRWRELERRVVLSQYLTAIQCAGRFPPQETGLTFNSWHGKFHLEMHWWHAVHFALWGRLPLLERSLGWYERILPRARATAAMQGYAGARWPKMTDPSGAESPSSVGPFLVWQQPHPIYYAELVYRERPERATLERFREVVAATAEFMASFARWDETRGRYVLGPPLQGAQEIFPKERTVNTAFELAYWRFGLEAAQRWRERLGLAREPFHDRVLASLSPLPEKDGRYLFAETAPASYEDPRWARDHPSVVGALGMLPGGGTVDPVRMRRSLDWIWTNWSFADTWGWDYPLLAMAAARLGQPGRAVDALLLDAAKNVHRTNGHNHQREGLEIYLPGNGGLLAAVAMMAAGWDGGPERSAPGFPADGSWTVRSEGLRRMP
jgi:hypothetical protein